ncbi:hypothetical protein ABZP36_025754 [Zizania latifolia]
MSSHSMLISWLFGRAAVTHSFFYLVCVLLPLILLPVWACVTYDVGLEFSSKVDCFVTFKFPWYFISCNGRSCICVVNLLDLTILGIIFDCITFTLNDGTCVLGK